MEERRDVERRRLRRVEAPPPRGGEVARARQLPLDDARLPREELEALVLDRVGAADGEALGPRLEVRELADVPRRAVGLEHGRRVDRVLEAAWHRRPLTEAQLFVHHAARPQQPAAARERVLVGLADGVDPASAARQAEVAEVAGPRRSWWHAASVRFEPSARSSSSGWCATPTTSPPSPTWKKKGYASISGIGAEAPVASYRRERSTSSRRVRVAAGCDRGSAERAWGVMSPSTGRTESPTAILNEKTPCPGTLTEPVTS